MNMRSHLYTVKFGVLVICTVMMIVWLMRSSPQSQIVLHRNDPWAATVSTKGKTKVLQHNGFRFERLHEFCTWTMEFDCHMMKTPVGRIPFYMHKPGTDAWMSDVLVKDQERDPGEIATIVREIRALADPLFVDIGSNLGVYSMVIAKTLQIRVIAVDPLIENVVRLCKTVQENKLAENITIIFNAIADKCEKVGFFKPFHHIAASRVRKFNDTYTGGPHTCTKPTSAMTCTLDDLVPLTTSKTVVLKMDAEAHEYKILLGGQRFLDTVNVPVIFMEWVNVKTTPDGKPLVDILRKRNYVAYHPDRDTNGDHLEFDNYLQWPLNVLWIKKA